MKLDLQNLLGLPAKDSSRQTTAAAPRNAVEMGFAHYLGLETVGERAKALPAKAVAAVSRTLGKKPAAASVPLPQASRTPAPAPAATRTPTPSAGSSNPSSIKQAIAAERARAAEIVVAGLNAGCVKQACSLAFDTDLSAKEAIAALNAASLDAASSSSDRRHIRMGLDPAGSTGSAAHREPTAKELAAQIVAAGEKAAGRTQSSAASNPKAVRIIAAGARARGETA